MVSKLGTFSFYDENDEYATYTHTARLILVLRKLIVDNDMSNNEYNIVFKRCRYRLNSFGIAKAIKDNYVHEICNHFLTLIVLKKNDIKLEYEDCFLYEYFKLLFLNAYQAISIKGNVVVDIPFDVYIQMNKQGFGGDGTTSVIGEEDSDNAEDSVGEINENSDDSADSTSNINLSQASSTRSSKSNSRKNFNRGVIGGLLTGVVSADFCEVSVEPGSKKLFEKMEGEYLWKRIETILTKRERDILVLYHSKGKTLEDISLIYELSAERIRQILVKAVEKIKTRVLGKNNE